MQPYLVFRLWKLSDTFHSSTRLTRFATQYTTALRRVLEKVSILYEANEVCNGPLQEAAPGGGSLGHFRTRGDYASTRKGKTREKRAFFPSWSGASAIGGIRWVCDSRKDLPEGANPRCHIGGLHKVAFALARGGLPGPCRRGS